MNIKEFVKKFFLCLILSSLCDAINIEIRRLFPHSSLAGNFLYVFYFWFFGSGNFIIGLLLFSIYFFVVVFLVRNTRAKTFYWLMSGWAVLFISTVTIDDWNLSTGLHTFGDYLAKGSHYSMFSVIVALVESLTGREKKKRDFKKNDERRPATKY